jgi:amidase
MPPVFDIIFPWLAIAAPELVSAHAANYPSRAAEYGPYLRQTMFAGKHIWSRLSGWGRRRREEFTAKFNAVLESVDAMACPAGGDPAWPITPKLQVSGSSFHVPWFKHAPRAAEFTIPMNFAGTPAICLPSGCSPDGMPYSIQFAARRLAEPMLCRIAHAYEEATSWHSRQPPV